MTRKILIAVTIICAAAIVFVGVVATVFEQRSEGAMAAAVALFAAALICWQLAESR